ncbi:MAG: peptidoglycan DD-metalloendopeptidase family protein [Firmicutes bacterium]|nr:peptidoglycan DD-metalloendopeptidase family protein [Bacillota bacterium]
MMKKKSLILMLIAMLTFTVCGAGLAFAATEGELRNELDGVETAQDELSKKMAQLEKDIKELQKKVDNLNYLINQTAEEISSTEQRIQKKEKEMTEREDTLNERLKVMYKNGSVGFVDILLGSSSISEFVSNVEIIQKIYKNDMDVLDTLKKEHEELTEIKASLEEKKATLAARKTDLAAEKTSLDAKKKEFEAEEDKLKAEADRLTAEIINLMDKDSPYVGGEFTWPCPASRYISSSFGNRLHPTLNVWKFHTGIDIGCSAGKNIVAAASGKVIMSQWYGGYGNCVMIDHGGGIVTLYGHASKLLVSKGQVVKQGQVIALVGSTGRSTGPHLHFEVRKNGQYIDPMSYF